MLSGSGYDCGGVRNGAAPSDSDTERLGEPKRDYQVEVSVPVEQLCGPVGDGAGAAEDVGDTSRDEENGGAIMLVSNTVT